ncbi:MAG: helix-turn-helix transcriptional regulator [Ardenticatenaceae bacterium]|nr:helix-turn-helix transcriptional regulator [Ardenticatenaceae bacterium]
MSNLDPRRATILAELVQKAREHARRETAECATALGLSLSEYEKVEAGDHPLSLPDLEALAMFFNVPMGYFWGSEPLANNQRDSYQDFIELRQRVIGVLLKQRRLRARQSAEKLAEAIGVDTETITGYESGDVPIPYLHLEQLSKALDVSVTHFVDEEHGPLARHEAEQRMLKQFSVLSPELQVFITKPGNESYLETAKKIGDMDVQKLRDLAASILDITF